jgi:putative ABC transport system permease protein
MMLVKLADPTRQEEVAAQIKQRYKDNSVVLTRDLPILIARGTPALQTFLNVVIALSIIVSSLVILLTMYTTVTERTRQIGVLKSLGASKFWIASEIEKEAVLISALGVVVGSVLAVAGKYLITRLTPISVELEAAWLLYALALGLLAGALGALYPALRAANQDAVTALAYE